MEKKGYFCRLNTHTYQMKLLLYLIYILCFAYITLFYGCAEKDHPLLSELVYIDSIVDEKPDSAAVLLSQIPFEHKKADKESEALYHLLQIKIALLLGDEFRRLNCIYQKL